jgi:hypothetical protein
MVKEDCVNDEWVEAMKLVSCWPYLRKITLSGDCMSDK